jgi:hypothetical protein
MSRFPFPSFRGLTARRLIVLPAGLALMLVTFAVLWQWDPFHPKADTLTLAQVDAADPAAPEAVLPAAPAPAEFVTPTNSVEQVASMVADSWTEIDSSSSLLYTMNVLVPSVWEQTAEPLVKNLVLEAAPSSQRNSDLAVSDQGMRLLLLVTTVRLSLPLEPNGGAELTPERVLGKYYKDDQVKKARISQAGVSWFTANQTADEEKPTLANLTEKKLRDGLAKYYLDKIVDAPKIFKEDGVVFSTEGLKYDKPKVTWTLKTKVTGKDDEIKAGMKKMLESYLNAIELPAPDKKTIVDNATFVVDNKVATDDRPSTPTLPADTPCPTVVYFEPCSPCVCTHRCGLLRLFRGCR